jgi:succinate--hydroxymethylglutarate CoA-transferase
MGLMHITGSRDGPPVKVGVAITDLTTGLYTSNSVMAALLGRAKTGKGQHIDVSLSDCQVASLANIASSALISGEKDSGRWGTAHRKFLYFYDYYFVTYLTILEASIVPYKGFKTKDGDILLGGGNDRLYGVICQKLGKPEWIKDERFVTNNVRVKNRVELEDLIEAETIQKTTQEWLDILEGSGMPYAAINDIQATLNHTHGEFSRIVVSSGQADEYLVLARDMVTEIDHPACGPMKLVNTPVKYSDSKPGIRTPPPTLGQHTEEILREFCDMNEADIQSLKEEGVVA